jgi:hypothetical protein
VAGTADAEAAASAARRSARAILAEARFHSPKIPRPLHGALRDIGRVLEAPLTSIEELVARIGTATPGGSVTVWVILGLIVLALSTLFSIRGARRALTTGATGASQAEATRPTTAQDLEREAAAAERDGRYAEAVRYRFQAGLRRLAERELITEAPGMLNGDIARILRSPAFDTLAGRFDEITYGGGSANEQDAAQSRLEWEQLLRRGGRS